MENDKEFKLAVIKEINKINRQYILLKEDIHELQRQQGNVMREMEVLKHKLTDTIAIAEDSYYDLGL